MTQWLTKRQQPYTTAGIKRLRCIRCGAQAMHQWQICSDGNNHRPICLPCDIALNRLVLEWFGHPETDRLMAKYELKAGI
jgi:NAD-dependent SIR2 family protein deacetylase